MTMSGIGVGLAHWEKTLTVSGIMATDNIDPKFSNHWTNDGGNSMDPAGEGAWTWGTNSEWHMLTGSDYRDKNVGKCELTSGATPYELNLGISDAYPCYYAHPAFSIKNDGSVPVLVHAVILSKLSYKANGWTNPIEFTNLNIELIKCTTYYVKFFEQNAQWTFIIQEDAARTYAKTAYDYSIHVTGDHMAVNTQLDPYRWGRPSGNNDVASHMANPAAYKDTIYGDLAIHFENGCSELATYDFTIGIVFYNWPELRLA